MAQTIDEFKGATANLARPTLFKVDIPSIIDGSLQFLCKAASLPASTVGIIEVPYMGRKIKIAGDRTFAEWQITVTNDSTMLIRKQFEDWSNLINDHELNTGPNQIATYKHNAIVQQLGTDGGVLAEYNLKGAWPTEISEVDLNFESNDTISEFTCSLAFDFWTRIV